LRVFRLSKTVYSPAVLGGQGGLVADGRWHSAGRPVVYTASSEALAVLELRVHLGRFVPQAAFTMHTLDVPDRLVETAAISGLARGWNAVPSGGASQQVGDDWLERGRTLALRVPSIHSRSDWNLLINPVHGELRQVRILAAEPYTFDARLF
jgi:RES domain-containing protein